MKAFFKIVALLILSSSLSSQPVSDSNNNINTHWFTSSSFGFQLSGIKKVDFAKSNYSPLIKLNAGRFFTPYLALSVGYKGYYFNYIGDNFRHKYNFFYGESILYVNKLLQQHKSFHKWHVSIHVGSGYFYNYHYNQPNICANFDVSFNLHIKSRTLLSLTSGAIMGWDIYQGNKDILPGAAIGITYIF